MNNVKGFTLVEAMVVLAVAGVTLTIGAPNLTGLLERNRVINEINRLTTHMVYARSMAVSSGESWLVICADNSGDWSSGWKLWKDDNRNLQLDGSETLIKVGEKSNLKLVGSSDCVGWDSSGFSVKGEFNLQFGNYKVVTVKPTGRVVTHD